MNSKKIEIRISKQFSNLEVKMTETPQFLALPPRTFPHS